MTHSPLPWKYNSSTTPHGEDATIYALSPQHRNPIHIARVYGPGILSRDTEERDANLRLIVHAVNNHEELVAALEGLLEQLDGIGIPDWHGAEGLDLSQARTIIHKVRK